MYLPSDQIELIRPYSGGEAPSLSKMGGADFARTKGAEPEVGAAFQKAVDTLRAIGLSVEEGRQVLLEERHSFSRASSNSGPAKGEHS